MRVQVLSFRELGQHVGLFNVRNFARPIVVYAVSDVSTITSDMNASE